MPASPDSPIQLSSKSESSGHSGCKARDFVVISIQARSSNLSVLLQMVLYRPSLRHFLICSMIPGLLLRLAFSAPLQTWASGLDTYCNCQDKFQSDHRPRLHQATLMSILRGRVLATEQIGAIPVRSGTSLWEEMSPPLWALGQLHFHYR